MHYYQHNIGDYRRDTSHLSLVEHGIYRQLMDSYYLDEQPLCADLAKLMRSHSVRSADEQQSLKNVLADFFELTENGYIHKRCDEVIAEYHGKSDKARASAMARWANKHKDVDANALPTQSKRNAKGMLTINQEPITSSSTTRPKKRKTAMTLNKDTMPENYEEFIKAERPDLNPLQTYYKFCDYWLGNGEVKADWLATWRNWVRNEKKQFNPKIEVNNFDEMMRNAK
jgi:uncharacterized protein YdaU (DUF1376 family)